MHQRRILWFKKNSSCIIFSFGISKIGTVALNHATIAIIIIVRIISHLSYNLCQNILKVCVIFENRCWKFTLIKRVKTNEATANNGANQIRIVFSSSNFGVFFLIRTKMRYIFSVQVYYRMIPIFVWPIISIHILPTA